ncbi:chemotaxis protein CheX [bacterium]|nr:chemotaxis protein CheX [bacterium]MBU1984083.1 chemotaxis protein CheX [bacterium]
MSIEVALIDFPRLQEQIATRLLAQYDVNTHRLGHKEAADRLTMFNLALFFWPDKADLAAERLSALKKNDPTGSVPVVLVTSEMGRVGAQAVLGAEGAVDVLITPLQPHIVSRKLADLLGLGNREDKVRLDVGYINPFVEATVNTLTQMAGMECERTGLDASTNAVAHGHISGTMGLSGVAEGFVSVTFSTDLARTIVCRMLQIETGEESEDDIRDGVGEFMNMVAGAAKAELANTEHAFQLSLPQVILGPHSLGQPRGMPVISIQFTTEGLPFEILVCLVPRKDKK